MAKILVAEDDFEIAMLERDYLEMYGHEIVVVEDGTKVEAELMAHSYDLLILDLMLPGKSGTEICKDVREKIDIPILMVTARQESIDKIRGLGMGADDYITKPFDPAELVARVKSHLARYKRLTSAGMKTAKLENSCIQMNNLKIMLKSWKIYKGEEEIKFTNREFELLKYLAMNPNTVFSKEHLFETIWGDGFLGERTTVTVHINRIREKIEDDPSNPKIIETIWGAGYRFNV